MPTTQRITTSRLAPVKVEARRIGLPYTTFRDLLHRGEIPFIRVGRAQYVERADTDAWIERSKERIEQQ
jgi:excisionase family DNA binding protein